MKQLYSFLFLLAALCTAGTATAQTDPFITTWNMANTGQSAGNLRFGIEATGGAVNYTWTSTGTPASGSGTIASGTNTFVSIPVSATGIVTLNLGTGGTQANLKRFFMTNQNDRLRLTAVTQWGTAVWTSFDQAFRGCSNLTTVSTIDAPILGSGCTMSFMFSGCTSLNAGAFNTWNTANTNNMSSMFQGATAFNQSIGNWNTSAVTNFGAMFQGAIAFNQDLSSWNVGTCTSFASMFEGAAAFNQDLSGWNVGAGISFSGMFFGATSYTNNGVSLAGWDMRNATSFYLMFASCKYNLPLNGANWCGTSLLGVTSMNGMFYYNTVFNQDLSCWNVSTVTNFGAMFQGDTAFNQDLSGWNVGAGFNFSLMFFGATSYTNTGVSLAGWDMRNATDLSGMFALCKYNLPLNGANWCGTSLAGVTSMYTMFYNNTDFNQDLSCWNVSTVTDFGAMFEGAMAFNQDLSGWNVGAGINFASMFHKATNYTNTGVSLAGWDMRNATSFYLMFASCKYNLPLNGANWCGTSLAGVTNMFGMFSNNTVFNQNLSCWNVSTVTNFGSMFERAAAFNQDLSGWNVGAGTNFSFMFHQATNYTNTGVSLAGWDMRNATNLSTMFAFCRYNLPLNGANWCGTSLAGVTNMSAMFQQDSVFNQDLSCWNVSTVTNFSSMFEGALAFNQDISGWNVGEGVLFSRMFKGATSYTNAGVSLAGWDMRKATDLRRMFDACRYNLPLNGANWCGNSLAGVTVMGSMFVNNTVFNQDISCWDVSTVVDFSEMFGGATAFNQSLGNWNINAATNMVRMLDNCGMDIPRYDSTLVGWNTKNRNPTATTFGAANLKYCTAIYDRSRLIATPTNLTPIGDALGCTPGGVISTFTNYWHMANRYGGTNGATIDSSFDQSGNNANFIQLTTGFRPTFTTSNTINFNPLFRFDGSTQYLTGNRELSSGAVNFDVAAGSRSASSSSSASNLPANSILSSPSVWRPATAANTEFLTLDLGSAQPVNGIVTAGNRAVQEWTTGVTVFWSTDNNTYTQIGGIYSTNTNSDVPISNYFPATVIARYIRIFPQAWNSYPALRADVFTTASTALTTFLVSQELVRQDNVVQSFGYTDANNQFVMANPNNSGNSTVTGLVNGNSKINLSTSNAAAVGVPSILSLTNTYTPSTGTGSNRLYINGKLSTAGSAGLVPTGTPTVGGLTSGSYFNGYIAEYCAYTTNFSQLDLLRINSYFALKYGLTMSNDLDGDGTANEVVSGSTKEGDYVASNGTTVFWTYAGNTAFNNNIFGIARDDNQGLNQQIARANSNTVTAAPDVLTISTDNNYTNLNGSHTTIATNNAFLVLGNNAAVVATTQSTNMPTATCGIRTARAWRAQVTGFGQPINIRADLTSLAATDFGTAPAGDIFLIIDGDGDNDFTTGIQRRIAATSYSGGIASFENVAFDGAVNATGVYVFSIARRYQPVPTLVAAGNVINSSIAACPLLTNSIYTYYRAAGDNINSYMAFNYNGNSFNPISVTIDNSGTLTGASGTFSNSGNGYYQTHDGITNTFRIGKRISSVVAPGSFTTNGGVIVRVYYEAADTAAMVADALPFGSITDRGWYKSSQNTPAGVVGTLSPTNLAGAVKVIPVAYGTEAGLRYVEFLTTSFSSFGYYVKTSLFILPVNLLSFTGVSNNCTGTLKWESATESDFSRYEVQQSFDDAAFTTISTVPANGSGSSYNYSFALPDGTTRFYRLKMVDNNGSFKYSQILRLRGDCSGKNNIIVGPNPVRNQLWVQVPVTFGNWKGILYQADGKQIAVYSNRLAGSSVVDMSQLPSGLYMLRIENEQSGTQTYKVIKQ